MARAIQESFLPESGASWKGFQATAHFEPAADLGGDFYDILPMPDGRTAVAIGDVSGHGLPDGTARRRRPRDDGELRRARRAGAGGLHAPRPPHRAHAQPRAAPLHDARVLRLRRRPANRHADQRRTSGSLPGRLRRPRRAPGAARPADRPPARSGRPPIPSRDYRLRARRPVVFFTDGVVEAADAADEPWGYERFEALLARDWAKSADELIRAVLAEVAAHVGATPLEDDRTLLVLILDPATAAARAEDVRPPM